MRKLVITENITLDGVIDASDGSFAPSGEEDVDQSALNVALREQAATADAVLLGRVTFEEMRGYWPLQTTRQDGCVRDVGQCREAETRGLSPVPLRHRVHALQREWMKLTR